MRVDTQQRGELFDIWLRLTIHTYIGPAIVGVGLFKLCVFNTSPEQIIHRQDEQIPLTVWQRCKQPSDPLTVCFAPPRSLL